jgi:hypothetical protein
VGSARDHGALKRERDGFALQDAGRTVLNEFFRFRRCAATDGGAAADGGARNLIRAST